MSVTERSNSEHGNLLPGLDSLGVHTVARILRHLTGTQCAQLACLSRTFRAAADDDELWNHYYRNEYPNHIYQRGLKLIKLRETGCVINFRYLYSSKGQAKRFWSRVKSWRNNEFNGLRKGASEKAVQTAEQALGFPLPLDVQEVYRRHDGQDSTRTTRSVDVESIIKNSVNIPWWHLPSNGLANGRLFVALPLFLDLEKAFCVTTEIRRYFFLMGRNRNYREVVGRNLNSANGWAGARNVIFSSIVFATISFQSLSQFLLLKCDTHEVYLFEYPSLLIQIPTKSKYDWFVPWIEGYTGFDETRCPCELPLSWYFVKDNDGVLQLQKECPNKIRDLFTFREWALYEPRSLSGLPPETHEAFIGANPCAILSRISGALVYNISTSIRPLSDCMIINYSGFEVVISLYLTPLVSDEAEAEDLEGQSLKDLIVLKQSSQQGSSHTSGLGIKHEREMILEDIHSMSKQRKTTNT